MQHALARQNERQGAQPLVALYIFAILCCMANPLSDAASVIAEAELSLRTLISKAVNEADYQAVQRIGALAERLGRLKLELGGCEPIAPMSTKRSPSVAHELPREPTGPRNRRRPYPRFDRKNGVLRKIGWSKKSKAEYEHRVPREAFQRTIEALEELSKSTAKIFTVDDIVPHIHGEAVPIYQIYVVLALLRERDFLKRQGRDGYVVSNRSEFKARSQVLWDELGDTA